MNSNSFDINYIADLARIELEPAVSDALRKDLEAIVGYIDQLNELDVGGIEPTAHAVALTNVMREDRAGESFNRETMLKNAPATIDDELIKVPKVIQNDGMA